MYHKLCSVTSVNTGLLAEHMVTKIFAHKICSIYTKKKLGGGVRWEFQAEPKAGGG